MAVPLTPSPEPSLVKKNSPVAPVITASLKFRVLLAKVMLVTAPEKVTPTLTAPPAVSNATWSAAVNDSDCARVIVDQT